SATWAEFFLPGNKHHCVSRAVNAIRNSNIDVRPRSGFAVGNVGGALNFGASSFLPHWSPAYGTRLHFPEALTLDSTLCHLDELEWQMKVAMIILNPTFLVFVQLVAP